MFKIEISSRFKKSYKRVKGNIRFKEKNFEEVLGFLEKGAVLPQKYNDHGLKGNMVGHRECHLAPDILLVYKYERDVLVIVLVNIGTHSDLFD
jgi:mRNA interferase YafQ